MSIGRAKEGVAFLLGNNGNSLLCIQMYESKLEELKIAQETRTELEIKCGACACCLNINPLASP